MERAAQAKTERDNMRIETITEVEQQPYTSLESFYKSKKNKTNGSDDAAMNKGFLLVAGAFIGCNWIHNRFP